MARIAPVALPSTVHGAFGGHQPCEGGPRMAGVVPMLAYEDGLAAFDRLIRAFGFRGRDRRRDAEGRLMHPGLDTGGGLAMLATPTPDHESPRHHREHCPRAAAWWRVPYVIDSVLLEVEDVDAHCERARARRADPERAGEPGGRLPRPSRRGSRRPPLDVQRPPALTGSRSIARGTIEARGAAPHPRVPSDGRARRTGGQCASQDRALSMLATGGRR